MSTAFSPVDTSLKAAGTAETLGAIGNIAQSYITTGEPGAQVSQLRSELESGELTNEKSSGVGAHADHSA